MLKSHWYPKKLLAIAATALFLSACGGSGSSAPPPPTNNAPVADAGADQTVDSGSAGVTLDGSGSSDSDGTVASYAWSQTAGTAVTLDETDPTMPTFAAPVVAADETLTFQLVVTDDDGASSAADTVDVVVIANAAPVANAGADQTVDEGTVGVTLDGSGSTDSDGTVEAYTWSQTAGTAVTLDETNPAMPTFTAPALVADETLTFELTVTDDDGSVSSADSVDVLVVANVPPTANAGADATADALQLVTLDGSLSGDVDGTIASFAWTQTAGPAVVLDETNPAMPTFTAPNVAADTVFTFELVVTDNDGDASTADSVDVTINPTLSLPFLDDFSDNNAVGWTFIDDSVAIASSWDASSGRLVNAERTNVRSGDLDETYRRGTYAFLDDSINLTNYRLTVDVTFRPTRDPVDDLGVMFRYTDNDHYYRFSMNGESGSTRLESKAGIDLGGNPIWRTLAHNFRGYEPGQTYAIEVAVDGPLIQVTVNNDLLFAAYDDDHDSGGIAMYTRDSIRFDNVRVDPLDTTPEIVIASPVADFVIPGGPRNVNIVAIARNVPAGTGSVDMEFVGEAACTAATETRPGEWTASCPDRQVGNHPEVRAFIRDNGIEVARDTNEDVFIGAEGTGDRYDAIGDSLTLGLYDNFQRDNLNLTDRKTISTRGWAGPLSDMLTTTTGQANLVGNEGISGDRSWETSTRRLDSIIERNSVPRSNRALLMLGTNDSNIGSPEPSGEGCTPGVNCDGTYKGYMIDIINQLQNNGRDIVHLAILPPVFGNNMNSVYADPRDAANARQNNIIEYNRVIVNELSTIPGVELGPDFFTCFLSPTVERFSLFEDPLHMNSLGYSMVAALWHDVLTGAPVVPPVDPCPAPVYIVEGLDSINKGFKQNLLEAGDEYYRDESFTLTNVPAELADAVWISQNNADNMNTDANFMTFDVGPNPVTVYIAYDPAGGAPTSSTHVFAPLGAPLSSNITTSDPAAGTFALVSTTAQNTVTIGGTMSDLSGIPRQAYLVIVVP